VNAVDADAQADLKHCANEVQKWIIARKLYGRAITG